MGSRRVLGSRRAWHGRQRPKLTDRRGEAAPREAGKRPPSFSPHHHEQRRPEMAEHTKTRTRRHTATPRPDGDASPTYIQLAGDALLAGMTHELAIAGLVSRIKRDQGYLAY